MRVERMHGNVVQIKVKIRLGLCPMFFFLLLQLILIIWESQNKNQDFEKNSSCHQLQRTKLKSATSEKFGGIFGFFYFWF